MGVERWREWAVVGCLAGAAGGRLPGCYRRGVDWDWESSDYGKV